MVLAATGPVSRVSCGYVGRSDGWTDSANNFQMDWEFDQAPDGNIALTENWNLHGCHEFTWDWLLVEPAPSHYDTLSGLEHSLISIATGSLSSGNALARGSDGWKRRPATTGLVLREL